MRYLGMTWAGCLAEEAALVALVALAFSGSLWDAPQGPLVAEGVDMRPVASHTFASLA